MTVVMQRNDEGVDTRHVYDCVLRDLLRLEASNGLRITDLEGYRSMDPSASVSRMR